MHTEKTESESRSIPLSYLSIIGGAALWGIIGLFSKQLSGAGLSAQSIVVVRAAGAAILLTLLFLFKRPETFQIAPRDVWMFIGTGIISFVLFNWCYFSCMERCSLSVSVILLYTAPTFVVLLSALLWKEKLTAGKITALVLTSLGCVLVAGIIGGDGTMTVSGFFFGLGSGLFYGLYSIFGRYALKQYSPYTVTLYTFLFAALGSLIMLRPQELAAGLSQPNMPLFAVLLVVISTVAPFFLYTTGLAKVESGKASILATVEPVVATLVSVLVFGEGLTLYSAAGILCILAAVMILR